MNLTRLKPAWDQFKVMNRLDDIEESEILSCIEPKSSSPFNLVSKRIAQNAFAYSLLIFALSGGCSI
ncbi:hypothetical protein SYJ56_07020 [Algoriphagus sp. D3-2-R+10]|uniref:hypothetical protein n=1 Tax=Algoriphagus aurantiacus TaxID=3103948 RepID=UPI002B39B7B1|nr:hypothetical protein [Algoriphagus sp. D3-2-R+10]MEB2775051.1 hypothetical protein [Algoriphagus sp. D3-2-R+10]